MRKNLILPVLLAAGTLSLTACGAVVQQVNENQFIVSEEDGNYDQRDLNRSCSSIGRQIVGRNPFNVPDGSAVLVTCSAPNERVR